jgi:rubredoxin
MAQTITVGGKTLYACEICRYVYEQRKTAEDCHDYCQKNKV